MAERPILFSAPMVLALLAGRKTMTRRLVTNRAAARIEVDDLLWVKETWRPRVAHSCGMDTCDCCDVRVRYAADGEEGFFRDGPALSRWTMPKAAERGNVSSLFLPRWASRLSLRVTGKRVERAHDISEEDAVAEGVEFDADEGAWKDYAPELAPPPRYDNWAQIGWSSAKLSFASLWQSINGAESWAANPEVFAFIFERCEPPAPEVAR